MSEEKKNIRIIDIAKIAGVSAGTVDRVLHNRGKVSAEKREKVEKVLKEINYQPNIIARSLAMKRHYTILAIIPQFEKGGYWDVLNSGIIRAAKELQNFNVDIQYLYFEQYSELSFSEQIQKTFTLEFDALLIAALFKEATTKLSRMLDDKAIPYVFIDSNVMDQNNLAYFGADSYNSGAVAAKLLMYEIGRRTDLFIAKITTNNKKDSAQTFIREQGFRDYLRNNDYNGIIHSVELSDNYTIILKDLDKIIAKKRQLIGGVVFNSRIHELANILYQKLDASRYIKLIGYDAIEKNLNALRSGEVSFLLSQRSDMQGYNGIKTLSNYLLLNRKPELKDNYMPIDILIKENMDYYRNYEE